MKIANTYNHLNAREYLIVNKNAQFTEICGCIASVNANEFLKISCDVSKLGQVFYSQGDINKKIKKKLNNKGWHENLVRYYVTGDEPTTKEIVNILDKNEQKRILDARQLQAYATFNQIDFQKDRIAVEVQFGKYFSVAYDLHVKHAFFYSRNDIDVGIEIIPTKAMEEHMDTGVPWFENEVTNVIREGRTNPPVPILILGIEPDHILSKDPTKYTDAELANVLRNSDIQKFRSKVNERRARGTSKEIENRIKRIEDCLTTMRV